MALTEETEGPLKGLEYEEISDCSCGNQECRVYFIPGKKDAS